MSKYKQFSAEYAKSVTKAEFIQQHEHHASEFDLGEVWEGFQPEPKASVDLKKKPKDQEQS